MFRFYKKTPTEKEITNQVEYGRIATGPRPAIAICAAWTIFRHCTLFKVRSATENGSNTSVSFDRHLEGDAGTLNPITAITAPEDKVD